MSSILLLRRRVHELNDAGGLSLDQLVGRLRTTFSKYARYKLRPFTIMVKKIIDSSVPSKKKKKKKIDGRITEPQSESSETYTSAVLTPEEVEPEFDLTKSMLRNKYKMDDPKLKHVELENKENTKVDVIQEDRGVLVDDDNWPRFKDLGGIDTVLFKLKMEFLSPLFGPDLARHLRVRRRPSAGILLHGPPGCGKTTLALAIANETELPFYKLSAPELVSGISGASEENIRNLFSKAYKTAPSIIFIDEIDAIASKRENLQRPMETLIVTQLMTCMDVSQKNVDGKSGYVLVIGATNRPDAIDPALRRRFESEITLGVPNENAREQILSSLTRDLKLEGAFDLVEIARSTPGFVGADLVALVNKAGNLAMQRIVLESIDITQNEYWWKMAWTPEIEKLMITMSDFEAATKLVQPSLKREGFSSIPNVKWEDIGGYDMLRREFQRHLVRRIKYPNYKRRKNRENNLETGFLLYGPPGCGKTLIAKAVAHEAGANFIHIKGPELLNKYVGESESAVRTIFNRARTCSPCIIFFDEVDALTTNRGKEGGSVVDRLVTQLLIELDGGDERKGIYVIGATNRPDVMDPAFLRPGRFEKKLFVPLPNADERGMILKALSRNFSVGDDVDLIAVGRSEACANFSGADLYALMNEAEMIAEDEVFMKLEGTFISAELENGCTINSIHFEQALARISPSVSHEQKKHYNLLSKSFKQIPKKKRKKIGEETSYPSGKTGKIPRTGTCDKCKNPRRNSRT